MSIRRRPLALAAVTICALAPALALSACSAAGCASAPRAPTPSPTAVAMPAPPRPVLDASCADLVPAADLKSMFGTSYPVRTDSAWLVSPREFAVRSAGGVACLWGSDVPEHKGGGLANAASDLLQVTLLPGVTAAQWEQYGDLYPQDAPGSALGDGSGTACFTGGSPSPACTVNVLVGDVWLEVLGYGIVADRGATDADLLARVSPVVARMVERIRVSHVIARQAPRASATAKKPCDALLPGDWARPSGGWDLVSSAAEWAGTATCLPADPDAKGVAAAAIELLPGGAWAFGDAVAATGVALNAERVTVAGTSVPGSYLRCPVPGGSAEVEKTFHGCSVDLAVGANWLRVSLPIDARNPWYVGMAGHLLNLTAEVVQGAAR